MEKGLPIWHGACEDLRLTDIQETWSYTEALADIYKGAMLDFKCYYRSLEHLDVNGTRSIASEFFREATVSANRFSPFLALILLIFAAVWTIVRYAAEAKLLLPLARSLGVFEKNVNKLSESAWKGTAYLLMWATAYYISFYRSYSFFTKPMSMFFSGNDGDKVPWDLNLIYALEGSFYIHSLYATLHMDSWRKDSVTLIIHHVVSLELIVASYGIGFLQGGCLTFLLIDIGDVILEYGKVFNYLKSRPAGNYKIFYTLSEAFSVLFASQWVILRLYLFVVKLWRASSVGVWHSIPVLPMPLQVVFIGLFGILYLMYLYWFAFILLFVKRVLSGNMDDPREDEEEVKFTKKTA